jgi:pimeloyl-ACP methyl ester carboxylesterase
MRVQVNDFSMAYDDSGDGIPILLIHGFPLNRKMWEPQISGLADFGRLIAPDLRGHGGSESIPDPFSPPAPFAMDLLA